MKKQLPRYTLIYGSLTALACLLFFIGLYNISPNPLGVRRPDIGFNIMMIFIALAFYRRNNGGYLHFYEGVSVGFLVNLFAAILTGLGIFIFVTFYDNTPFTTWTAEGVKEMYSNKETFDVILDKANFDRTIASLKNAKPYQLVIDEIMFKQFSIIPITLISMALRKQRPTP
ncbi:MAG: DUF4199 domain-containing protein [Spirosomaceae bacterium]|nr:DUF4199 domain-containing protein [Spirosomataceae bacterium]